MIVKLQIKSQRFELPSKVVDMSRLIKCEFQIEQKLTTLRQQKTKFSAESNHVGVWACIQKENMLMQMLHTIRKQKAVQRQIPSFSIGNFIMKNHLK